MSFIYINTKNKTQKMFDLHYLYENTKCCLVDFQKNTKPVQKGKEAERPIWKIHCYLNLLFRFESSNYVSRDI